ncbi:MAG TPA: hypothetical protein VFU40_09430 [Gemmatimonadales bacterium]|nr:hypothetical protein [Gemmatimonadales bacterium]
MTRFVYAAFTLTLLVPQAARAQTASDSGTFVIRHARNIVATEQFSRNGTRLEGTLFIKDSRNTNQRYLAVVAPDATLPLIEVTVREGTDSAGRKPRITQRARVIFKDDSVAVDALGGDGLQSRLFATDRGAVPYLNLSFALLEQALRRARVSPDTTMVAFFNLGGGQTLAARVTSLGTDSLRLEIGSVEYHLRVDRAGRVLGARIPAQDLVAERK